MVRRLRDLHLIAVNPNYVHLLIYPGGYCGEFIGYWLSQHPGCIPAQVQSLMNNRYIHTFNDKFVISTALATTTDDRLFLLAHSGGDPKNDTTFNGILKSDINSHSEITCSTPFKKFFFLMMWLKMRLYKFLAGTGQWNTNILSQFNDTHTYADFQNYIDHRDWFYQFEIDSFKQDKPNLDIITRAHNEYLFYNLLPPEPVSKTINLDELMFGDVEKEHQRICEQYELDYDLAQPLTWSMRMYHQRNLRLAQRYLDIPIEQLLAIDYDDAWLVIKQAIMRCYTEPSLV